MRTVVAFMIVVLVGPAESSCSEPTYNESQRQSIDALAHIYNAFASFHAGYGALPPCSGKLDGRGFEQSWRILLYPFVISDGFLGSYAKDEPWDSETNRHVIRKKRGNEVAFGNSYFSSKDDVQHARTRFIRVCGPGTLGEGVSFENIQDGMGKTILLIIAQPPGVPWTEPKDLNVINAQDSVEQIQSFLKGERIALFANGDIRILSEDTTLSEFRAMCTYRGNDAVDLKRTTLIYRALKGWIDD